MKKIKNLKHVIGFMKKKVNLGILRVSPYVLNGIPQSCLDLLVKHFNIGLPKKRIFIVMPLTKVDFMTISQATKIKLQCGFHHV
jgi:hypothetical protein